MTVRVPRGPGLEADDDLRAVAEQLERYVTDHPGAEADLYRQGDYLIRVRVVDERFAGVRRGQRHQAVWDYLLRLPEEVVSDVSYVVPITPDERPRSGASREFDDPTPLYGTNGLFQTHPAPSPAELGPPPGPVAAVPPFDVYQDQPDPTQPRTP